MVAIGIGLGVALLLGGASIPTVTHERSARMAGYGVSEGSDAPANDHTLLVAYAGTEFGDLRIRGLVLQPEGSRPPVPPGLTELPGPGELVVSPALAGLLASPEGALLRPRLDYPVVGTIGDAGLAGPGEYAFYLGGTGLRGAPLRATRIESFGANPQPAHAARNSRCWC